MTPKHLYILLLALIAISGAVAQNDEIPLENDNQFPPEIPSEPEGDVIDGSGDGAVEEPPASTESTTTLPQLEEVQPTEILSETSTAEDQSCPSPCICHYEGATENFIVDCAGYNLEVFPAPVDPKTTTLYVQNNKITEIPKEVSTLKKLKVLNAENNSIMNLAHGSVSELPELKILKLGNNRLIEYPQDLKNSLSLTKLEELDIGGNDMRTELTPETFSNFKALRKLTLATSNPNLLQDLCDTLKTTLEQVCTESCDQSLYECTDTPKVLDDDLIDATYPGMISFEGDNGNSDPMVHTDDITDAVGTDEPAISDGQPATNNTEEENSLAHSGPASILSGLAVAGDTPEDTTPQKLNRIAETPNPEITKTEEEVKIGATTTSENSGGVSKSVIGLIVAGMIVVVAGIAVTKNWSSIRKRFSSTPRPGERSTNANGNTPEEVPLQEKDKSPV